MSTDFTAVLGSRVRELRLQRGLGVCELAKQAGMSHSTLSEIESGVHEPSASKVAALAKALGVKPSRLFPE